MKVVPNPTHDQPSSFLTLLKETMPKHLLIGTRTLFGTLFGSIGQFMMFPPFYASLKKYSFFHG